MSGLLDVVLLLVLVAYLVQGYRLGLVRSIGAIAGVIAGAVAASLLSPVIGSVVPDDTGRVVATIVAAIVLVLLGHAAGAAIGAAIGGVLHRSPLGVVDRVLGAVAGIVVSALAMSVVATLAVSLGVPFVAQPIAGSAVLRRIDQATPPAADRVLAQLQSTVLGSGIPELGEVLRRPDGAAAVPEVDLGAPALTAAGASVVKITGRAPECGQEQTGSGFVVAEGRVLTNAHVLTGVTEPVVLTRDGQAVAGRVTFFDPGSDVALIAVPGLDATVIPVGPAPQRGDEGVVAGYPFGGPFTPGGAQVLETGTTRVPDVLGGGSSARAIASLAADVEQGNSGGPLLDLDGAAIGMVFAKSAGEADLAYALAPAEFEDVVADARALRTAVGTGACSRD